MKQKILIVSHSKEDIRLIESILVSIDAEKIVVNSETDALSILLSQDISLVLLEAQMPGIDSFELAHLIKANKKTSKIPILFLTAFITDEKRILEGYNINEAGYIVKPINPAVLLSKVNVCLSFDAVNRNLMISKNEVEDQKLYFESILNVSLDGILSVNQDGVIEFANPAALKFLKYNRDELVGRPLSLIFPKNSKNEIFFKDTPFYSNMMNGKISQINEFYFTDKKNEEFPVSLSCSPLSVKNKDGMVIVFKDITLQKKLENKISEQSKKDFLTGLANRITFFELLDQFILRAKRTKNKIAVFVINIDRFKQINESLGNEMGDLLLKYIAERITFCVRQSDIVSRLGSDVFGVIIDEFERVEDVARIAEKIIQSLRNAFLLVEKHEIIATASLGIAIYPDSGETSSDLMQAAELAMHQVKSSGRDDYRYFSPETNAQVKENLLIEQELKQAMSKNEFELYFQPQFCVQDRKLLGLEALLRWHRSKTQIINPDVFIPILEETGLIVTYGRWVISQACAQMKKWLDNGVIAKEVKISVNVSAKQFSSNGFFDFIKDTLHETQLEPKSFVIEITESLMITNPDQVGHMLEKMRDLGIRIAIDDFGKGYSSLNYLKNYPIDILKIDSSFLLGITKFKKDKLIVRSIIDIGHALDFQVLVEGLETQEQYEIIADMGADGFQGDWVSKPLSAQEVPGFTKRLTSEK